MDCMDVGRTRALCARPSSWLVRWWVFWAGRLETRPGSRLVGVLGRLPGRPPRNASGVAAMPPGAVLGGVACVFGNAHG
eukprot:7314216-Prymnesium_polylepis.1